MFLKLQLDLIQAVAKKKKNQGELSVYEGLLEPHIKVHFGDVELNIIKYCAEECKRQHSGEMSVYDMVNAWNYALSFTAKIDLQLIVEIGILVEPIDNAKGFRTIPIGVTDGYGGWIEKAQWQDVPRKLEFLLECYYDGSLDITEGWYTGQNSKSETAEDEFYFNYEEIHPFRDGNGRSGKILYNYLRGTLDNPVIPPNFWGGSNP